MLNANKPQRWNDDTQKSVLQYNEWFLTFAPETFQTARLSCIQEVEQTMRDCQYFSNITPDILINNPKSISILRMACAPPIAKDRLAGLSYVSSSKVNTIEKGNLPKNIFENNDLIKLLGTIHRLLDTDLCVWLKEHRAPTERDITVASSVISDRLCLHKADPIMRNAQERRQLNVISEYLIKKGFCYFDNSKVDAFHMPRASFSFRKNILCYKNGVDNSGGYVNIPVDVVIKPEKKDMPIFIECKSAGDYTNTNKRRKEEDTKVKQLKATFGQDTTLYLFLCGYFDSTYLGYEAANGLDWIWEHRIFDLDALL